MNRHRCRAFTEPSPTPPQPAANPCLKSRGRPPPRLACRRVPRYLALSHIGFSPPAWFINSTQRDMTRPAPAIAHRGRARSGASCSHPHRPVLASVEIAASHAGRLYIHLSKSAKPRTNGPAAPSRGPYLLPNISSRSRKIPRRLATIGPAGAWADYFFGRMNHALPRTPAGFARGLRSVIPAGRRPVAASNSSARFSIASRCRCGLNDA